MYKLTLPTLILSVLFLGISAKAEELGEQFTLIGPASCNAPGRYEIIMHPTIRADTVLLDTCLGRVWQVVEYKDLNGKKGWLIMPRLDNRTEMLNWETQELRRLQ